MHQAIKVKKRKMGSKRNGAEKTETRLGFSITHESRALQCPAHRGHFQLSEHQWLR